MTTTSRYSDKGVICVAGRLFLACVDLLLVGISFLGLVVGVFILLGGSSTYFPDWLGMAIVGSVLTAFSLCILLAWGLSYRLTIMNQELKQMRRDLDQLIRETQR